MKIFSIDTLPLESDLIKANDYNSKLIYSAISDPLFKYSKEKDDIVPFACQKYTTKFNYKKYIVTLRDDLFFANGQKVNPEDYYNCFLKALNTTSNTKFVLENVKSIEYDQTNIIFNLKHPDKLFYKKLSLFNLTPINNGISSGPYYIINKNLNSITVKRNKYFRKKITNKNNDILTFKIFNFTKEIDAFNKGLINMTNNTMFPLDKVFNNDKLVIMPNNLSLNLNFHPKFLNKRNRHFRKYVMGIINREQLKKIVYNVYEISNDFLIKKEFNNNDNLFKNKGLKHKYKQTLTLGYDDFYPNEIIALELQKQFKKYGIILKLVNHKFELKNICDLNLVINYPNFNTKEGLIFSKYFRLIYKNILFSWLFSLYNITSKDKILNIINYLIIHNALKIPLLKLKSIYLCDIDLKKFNHLEFNFEDL